MNSRPTDQYFGIIAFGNKNFMLASTQTSTPLRNASILLEEVNGSFLGNRMITLRNDQGSHNLCPLDTTTSMKLAEAFHLPANSVFAVGGQYHSKALESIFKGISLYTLEFTAGARYEWRFLRTFVDGYHPGSIERRSKRDGISEFDGLSTLVFFKNQFFLYSRANCALQGCRQLQVATSRNITSFKEFELCRFSNATLEDNIYFAHIYVIDRVLVAVVPAALAQGNGIHLYISEDGFFFVHQRILKPCMVHNCRTYDVPIAGASFSQSFLRLGIVENATKRVPPHIQETDIFSWRTFDLRSLFTTLGISCP